MGRYDLTQEFRPFTHGRPDPEGFRSTFLKVCAQHGVKLARAVVRNTFHGDAPGWVRTEIHSVVSNRRFNHGREMAESGVDVGSISWL